ncbi:MAG: methyltransferase domain-containing protein [Nitrospirae bacterium]|nr:methyltransferase domain-containing protein [Nitrospirota bacterium]
MEEIPFTAQEIQEKYEKMARHYDLLVTLPEWLGFRKLRRQLLRSAGGRLLEVAVGTGRNLPHYPSIGQLTAVDLSPSMVSLARRQSDRLGMRVSFAIMDGEALAFPEAHFDTVVSTLALCTFPDPVGALREMARVCQKNGRILLLEHGRSDREWLGQWQDRRAPRHAEMLACHWNREPLQLIRQAGLTPVSARRIFLGVIHMIEIKPS